MEARCVDRVRDAPAFVCRGDACRQRSPRLPDDGEWECADFDSVVVCHGGLRAAGVAPGGSDAAYFCGPRRGALAREGERVCVDFSPDLPDGAARGYVCHFANEGGGVRVCTKNAAAPSVAGDCDASRPCDGGLVCAEGHCVPRRPSPSCWLDRDYDKGICRFGACDGDAR